MLARAKYKVPKPEQELPDDATVLEQDGCMRSGNRVIATAGTASQAGVHGRASAEADKGRSRGMGETSRAMA